MADRIFTCSFSRAISGFCTIHGMDTNKKKPHKHAAITALWDFSLARTVLQHFGGKSLKSRVCRQSKAVFTGMKAQNYTLTPFTFFLPQLFYHEKIPPCFYHGRISCLNKFICRLIQWHITCHLPLPITLFIFSPRFW